MDFRKNTACIGMLAGFGVILTYLEVPLPFMPPFMKLDISDVPSVVGLFFLGLPSAILITAVKDLIHLFVSDSLGIGEICNFLVALIYLTTWHAARLHTGRKWAYAASILAMTASAAVLNAYVLLPLYQAAFHITEDQLLSLTRAAGMPAFSIAEYLIMVVVPFNLLKGALIAMVSELLRKRIVPWFDRFPGQ